MKVSVIVPAFNEEKLIAQSLRSIKAALSSFTARGWETEVVVCDNNSTDRTAAIAADEGAVVVFEPVNQIGRARNAGARAASGDWLIFVDADSFPSSELFAATAEIIASGKAAAGGAVIRMDSRDRAMDLATWTWNQISKLCKWMAGSFIFCDAKAFREVGGFSSALYVSEELDLSRRLKVWAKASHRKIVIITKHPMLSSARKAGLYSRFEFLKLFARVIFSRGRAMRDPQACNIWYDGRR